MSYLENNTLLTKKVESLQQKLKEEKDARVEIEKIIEQQKDTIEDAQQHLNHQIEMSKQREQQLEFITALIASTLQESSIARTLSRFLLQCAQFLTTPISCYFNFKKQSEEVQLTLVEGLDEIICDEIKENKEKIQLNYTTLLAAMAEINYESQLVLAEEYIGFQEVIPSIQGSFIFVLPIRHSSKHVGLAIFFYREDNDIDILKLQTLESARTLINLAIQQKVASQSLKNKYEELHSTYLDLENAQNQLIQSEKMASLGQLAAGVAHEINNPIGFVLSNFEVLRDYIVDIKGLLTAYRTVSLEQKIPILNEKLAIFDEEYDVSFILEDLNTIVDSSKQGLERVRTIVAGLKTFSHGDNTTFSTIDLSEVLQHALGLTMNQLKYDYEIESTFDECPQIHGNQGQLEQVFINMIINGCQAMDKGGILTLKTVKHDKTVEVIIGDTGCGIEPENLKKLFTPFFTTKPVGVGTGLGLSISYAILENHNAAIHVESEINKGTQFHMKFPINHDVIM